MCDGRRKPRTYLKEQRRLRRKARKEYLTVKAEIEDAMHDLDLRYQGQCEMLRMLIEQRERESQRLKIDMPFENAFREAMGCA